MTALQRNELSTFAEAILRPRLRSAPRPRPPKRLVRAVRFVVDVAVIGGAATFATFAYYRTLSGLVAYDGHLVTPLLPVAEIVVSWVPFLLLAGLYGSAGESWGSGEFSRVVRAITVGSATHVMLRFAVGVGMPPRLWALAAWGFAVTALLAERLLVRRVYSWHHAHGKLLRRTLVVGTNSEAATVVHALTSRRLDGFAPIGCLASSLKDKLSLDYTAPILPTLGTARDLMRLIYEHEIDTVIVVSSAFDHEVLERLISELSETDVDVFLSSSLADVLLSRVSVREVAGIPLIALHGISLTPGNLLMKRTFDLIGALLVIVAGLPVWLVVAALIKLTSKGPVFYVQERVGLHGRPFGMYKFRSMVVDADERLHELRRENGADDGRIFKMREDPRITTVGRWMRRFSVDEFPQLINVVLGDMSIVGPRPPLPSETMYYDDYQWRRLEVVPGMTGLWQVSGRSELSFDEMVDLDLFYIGNWRLALDMSILLRTIPAVLLAKGAW